MKVGDYVAKVTSEWEKHNRWMEFPDEKPQPLGVIVGGSFAWWEVLMSCGGIERFNISDLKVINESR